MRDSGAGETKSGLKCCAAVHLRKSGLALSVYDKIGEITAGGKPDENGKPRVFYASSDRLAELIGVRDNSIRRVMLMLVKLGFLEKEPLPSEAWAARAGTNRPKWHRYVSHDEWSRKHPGQCHEPLKMPWSDAAGDQLGRDLYRISTGNVRWFPQHLVCLRNTGLDDSQIAREWSRFIDSQEKSLVYKNQWYGARNRFLSAMKAAATKNTKRLSHGGDSVLSHGGDSEHPGTVT